MTTPSSYRQLSLAAAVAILAACGPEDNSRYGDDYWDPQDTWEKAGVVSQPKLTVEYRDTDGTPDDDVEVWEAYVSIDFDDLSKLATSSVQLTYFIGTSSNKGVDETPSLLQSNSSFSDTQFYYDTETGTDYRLKLTSAEVYNFQLDFQVVQPNGTTRDYDFIYNDIMLPGPVMSYDYYTNNIGATLGEYCTRCHAGGDPDAETAFELQTNETNRRTNFLAKVNSTVGEPILTYPFTDTHTGSGDANLMSTTEKDFFEEYIELLLAEKEDGETITSDIEIKEISKPSIMAIDPWAP